MTTATLCSILSMLWNISQNLRAGSSLGLIGKVDSQELGQPFLPWCHLVSGVCTILLLVFVDQPSLHVSMDTNPSGHLPALLDPETITNWFLGSGFLYKFSLWRNLTGPAQRELRYFWSYQSWVQRLAWSYDVEEILREEGFRLLQSHQNKCNNLKSTDFILSTLESVTLWNTRAIFRTSPRQNRNSGLFSVLLFNLGHIPRPTTLMWPHRCIGNNDT